MNKEELLRELKVQFDKEKQRLGFKASFEEINKIAYIEDMVLSEGFVSNQFSRQLINRIVSSPHSWIGELHSWLYPPQMDMIHLNESKLLSTDERKEISRTIDRIMYFVRKHKRIAFDGLEPKQEADFIDEMIEFKKNEFYPLALKYTKKFEEFWKSQPGKKESKISFSEIE